VEGSRNREDGGGDESGGRDLRDRSHDHHHDDGCDVEEIGDDADPGDRGDPGGDGDESGAGGISPGR
jgi:hypothetical protein